MGWFHYGNTERYLLERWTKEYLLICLLFSGTEDPPKGPQGSPTVPNGQTSVPWEVEIIFYYGIISLWKYWALLILEVDKGIFGDLRHFLLFSGYKGSHKGPLGSPTILNGQTIVPWEVGMKYSTMGWFHYGNTERYSLERWTKEYLMIWGIFLLFSGSKGPPKNPLGSPMVLHG